MPKKDVPIAQLQDFLPDGVYAAVLQYLNQYKVHLTITKERKSVLGDYRHRTTEQRHRISVNGNLNKYSFLITLLHELAHLLTFEQFGNRVQAHGKEWKAVYGQVLQQFVLTKVFPEDIENELLQSLKNPAASSCAEEGLLRVLRRYDKVPDSQKLVEELAEEALFATSDGRIFQKGKKLRKRYLCKELKTGKTYLFSGLYPAHVIQITD